MANNCDDLYRKIQELEGQLKERDAEIDGHKRRLAAVGDLGGDRAGSKEFTFRTEGDQLGKIDDAEVERMMHHTLARMEDPDTKALVDRSLGEAARPHGIDGFFENYKRLLATANPEDFGKITEAMWKTWERFQPGDFRFITEAFNQERVDALAKNLRKEFGGSSKKAGEAIMAAMKRDSIGFMNLPERKVRIRLTAELARYNLNEHLLDVAEALEAIPGMELPAEFKQKTFSLYKWALLGERHDRFANRKLGQALQSQQLDLGDPTLLNPDMTEAAALNRVTPDDVGAGSIFAKIRDAIERRDPAALRELSKIDKLDRIDPNNTLERGWENPHVRYAIALAKDSQLFSIRPQLVSNLGGNSMMNLYGPLKTYLENVGYLAHNGTSWNRALVEGYQTSWNASRVAADMTRGAMKDLVADAFHSGKVLYGGNADFPAHGKTFNDELLAKVQAVFNQPLLPVDVEGDPLLQPQILARGIGKLMAGPRLLLFEKSGSKHHWMLTPGFRGMAGIDNPFGFHAYVYKLRNDLELRARVGSEKGGIEPLQLLRDKEQADRLPQLDEKGDMVQIQLGEPLTEDDFFDLENPVDRQEWIDREVSEAFYTQAPTEQEIKAYRREHRLKSDVTDDEISDLLSERTASATYQAPRPWASPSATAAQQYSDWTRMQHEQVGALKHMDTSMVFARKHWAVDASVPYWRAPFNSFLFDTSLGFPPLARTGELLYKAKFGSHKEGGWASLPAAEVARVQAGWATSGLMLGLFAGLDAAGLIVGNGPMNPREREEWRIGLKGKLPNSIAGISLSGLPVFNTLFLWKDLKDAQASGAISSFDQDTFWSLTQVLTSQIIRQTGFAQLQNIFQILTDPTNTNRVGNFAAFMGNSFLNPLSGVERSVEWATGSGPRKFYQPGKATAEERYHLPQDDPFEQIRADLNNRAYQLEPGAWSIVAGFANMLSGGDLVGDRRITEDWLGSSIRFPYGTDASVLEKHPGSPQLWPAGNDKLYGELDAQNLLVPPTPLRERTLQKVSMSPTLQKEYNHIYGHTKGEIPLSARLSMDGKAVQVVFPIPFPIEAKVGGKGVYMQKGESATINLGPFLDKHVQGKTVQQALRSLINDPIYQRMQDTRSLTNDPARRDMPPSERRKKAASEMIQGVKTYYELLALDRMYASTSPAATEWREKVRALVPIAQKESIQGIGDLPRVLSGAGAPQ